MPSVTMPIHPYKDDIPAFALSALDSEEALQVREHLVGCLSCRVEVATYQAVIGLLCYAIPPQEPATQLCERILTHIALDTESWAARSG